MKKMMVLLIMTLGLGLVYAGAAAGNRAPAGAAGDIGQNRSGQLSAAAAVGTAFTYQGRLTDGDSPADGPYDFVFLLFDDPNFGNQVGPPVGLEDVSVVDGLFTVALDFGDVFDGRALWLEVRVRPGAETGVYTSLAPRQALTAAPYAHSLRPGLTISGVITGHTQGALNVNNTQGIALFVASGNSDGLVVDNSAFEGVQVNAAGTDGIYVDSAGDDGVFVDTVGGDGVYVNIADDHGFHVSTAGKEGVYVGTSAEDGVYVAEAGEHGINASSTSASHYGGYFANIAAGGGGIYASAGDNATADGVLDGSSGILSSDPSLSSSSLIFRSYDDVEVRLDLDSDEPGFFVVYNDVGGIALIVDESGNLTAAGTKSAMVEVPDQGLVKLYALESPENWFEDFGTASLLAGETTVTIEPRFAATINLERDYHVFLTPLGDCALYVAEKTAVAFSVRALGGAMCSVEFDYRIVAKRLGYEDLRLEPVDLARLQEGE